VFRYFLPRPFGIFSTFRLFFYSSFRDLNLFQHFRLVFFFSVAHFLVPLCLVNMMQVASVAMDLEQIVLCPTLFIPFLSCDAPPLLVRFSIPFCSPLSTPLQWWLLDSYFFSFFERPEKPPP